MYSPKYLISNKILKSIGEIEAAKEVIENAPLVPSFEKQFQSDAVVRTVHHGTHIEGNDLTLMQTRKVLEGEAVVARARDIQEVVNYRNVVELLDELAYKRGEYDIELLKDIQKVSVYKIVPEDKIGVFRKSQVVIKNEETGEVILHPPSFVEVPFLIEDFIAWLNSKEEKEVHKQSSIIAQRDLTPWLEYFTHVVATELAKIKEKVKKLSMDSRLKLRIGSQVALSERQMRLVEFISDRGAPGMKELRSVLKMVSEDTILRDLRDLLDKGIIKKEGSTKASRYVI